jgi:hypothetical protein
LSSVSVLQPICELDEDFAELLLDLTLEDDFVELLLVMATSEPPSFLLLLDPIIPLELQDDSEESSSFEEVLLSLPQAASIKNTQKNAQKRNLIPRDISTPIYEDKIEKIDVNRLTIEKNYRQS